MSPARQSTVLAIFNLKKPSGFKTASGSIELAKSAGAENFSNNTFESEKVKNLKTSALMRLAVRLGAILAGAPPEKLAHLSRFANLLGDAYQLSDDLIDLREDGEIFGQSKTFAIEQGEIGARGKLENLIAQAKLVLTENFPASEARDCLLQLSDYLAERKA
jgi:geranylgeranyl diphosphate synthase type II